MRPSCPGAGDLGRSTVFDRRGASVEPQNEGIGRLGRNVKMLALDIPDREAILSVLEDCPEALLELRATLLQEQPFTEGRMTPVFGPEQGRAARCMTRVAPSGLTGSRPYALASVFARSSRRAPRNRAPIRAPDCPQSLCSSRKPHRAAR